MEKVSFLIFIPDGKKFHLTPNWIVLSLWSMTLAFFYFFENTGEPLGTLPIIWLVGVFLVSMFYLFASFFTYLPLNGVLSGEIEFKEDQITINEEVFELQNIKEIDFSFANFYGQSSKSIYSNFNPRMSRGVDNYVLLTDKENQTRVIYFQIQTEHSYLELAPFINEAIRAKKMPLQRGIDLVGAENLSN